MSARHSTQAPPLCPAATSHRALGAAQSMSPLHTGDPHLPTPAPGGTSHTAPAGQSLRPGVLLHPSTHRPAAPLQTRPEVAAPHSRSPSWSEHPHKPSSVRHTGLAPAHKRVSVAVHSAQLPVNGPLRLHTGRSGSAQPPAVHGTHVWVVASHVGLSPPQSAWVRHSTHRLLDSRQRGAFAGHRRVSTVLHSPHEPASGPWVRHTGWSPPHVAAGLSPHARHVCDTRSQ